jgi:hypothetical protein
MPALRGATMRRLRSLRGVPRRWARFDRQSGLQRARLDARHSGPVAAGIGGWRAPARPAAHGLCRPGCQSFCGRHCGSRSFRVNAKPGQRGLDSANGLGSGRESPSLPYRRNSRSPLAKLLLPPIRFGDHARLLPARATSIWQASPPCRSRLSPSRRATARWRIPNFGLQNSSIGTVWPR